MCQLDARERYRCIAERRLRELESELEYLESSSRVATMLVVPNVRERFRRMLNRLPEVLSLEPARAREALREVLSPEITLRPAAGGGYLEAEFGIETMPLAACAGGASEKMVAGARFNLYHACVSC